MEVWPYIPQTGVTESLEWLTDVIRCKAGEDRVALRHLPRQTYQMKFQLAPGQYAQARVFARQTSQGFLMPMWPHYVNTGNLVWGALAITGQFDPRFFSGRIIVWEDAQGYEIHTVKSVTSEGLELETELGRHFFNAAVVPLQEVRWGQTPDFTIANNDWRVADIRVKAINAVELAPSEERPKYRGLDVLLDPNILVQQLREQHYREVDEIDNTTGIIAANEKFAAPETKTQMSWHPLTRAELYSTLEWIHSRRGRRHAFWYRSHNADLEALSTMEADAEVPGTSRLEVAPMEGLEAAAPFDICVTHVDGSRRFCRVQGTTPVSSTRTRLILSGSVGAPWPLADIAEINFLVGVRFDADRIEIRHTRGGAATVSVPVIEVPGL